MNGTLLKADKNAFAIYQTIYANADTNLNLDWEKRLNDTKWTDECYWVMLDKKRIGGILILNDCTRFPFLIEPYCDRTVFWRVVIQFLKENKPNIHKIYSVLDVDIAVLLSFGYRIEQSRRMMCRPTDTFPLQLDVNFACYIPDINQDLKEMTDVVIKGYKNGIDYLLDPSSNEEDKRKEASDDLIYFLNGYAESNTLHHSALIRENATNKIVGLCIAGQHPKESHPRFSSIADITILPEYRGMGLAKYMIQNALTNAATTCDAMMLCVTVGNNAEALYRSLGFWGGPRFTSMSKLFIEDAICTIFNE